MAKQPSQSADPAATYDDAASYRVDLARALRFDGLLLRGEITMTGAAILRLIAQEGADVVLSAEKL
ncbi:MAG: hypothetical protein QHC89_01825 [Bosea sp. (in: a-proteobacteria)]|nr:hypothetical protein [Bosea sp. (in: a-proteobacteria)]